MAAYQFILFIALLFVSTVSLTYGFNIKGTQIAKVDLLGRVTCTIPGAQPLSTSRGIAGVDVAFFCNGGRTNLVQLVTNSSGFFNVVLDTASDILFDIPRTSCYAKVELPVAECAILPTNGTLFAIPALLGVTQTLLGQSITNYLVGPSWFII